MTDKELILREIIGTIYARGAEDLIHHKLSIMNAISEFMPKIQEVL